MINFYCPNKIFLQYKIDAEEIKLFDERFFYKNKDN